MKTNVYVIEHPALFKLFFIKYGLSFESAETIQLIHELLRLTEKSVYDIENGITTNDVEELARSINLGLQEYAFNEYVHCLNYTITEYVIHMVMYDLFGHIKYVAMSNDYKFILEAYKL